MTNRSPDALDTNSEPKRGGSFIPDGRAENADSSRKMAMDRYKTKPLDGITVLDFSSLLPGPMCSLLLAESGAQVIKIERPGQGDEMRSYKPAAGRDSANFILLNRGKSSITLDLKSIEDRQRALSLIETADVLIEQFRPGVMARLGLSYESVREVNPRIIYCSISGYGQSGPARDLAAHDLNYMARSGLLSLTGDSSGNPNIPCALIADIAAGAYPAVMNILLAIQQRTRSGEGVWLDIAMGENLLPMIYWALGEGELTGRFPGISDALVTGGSARYQIYRTADDRFLSVAPIEERFWQNFCEVIDLPVAYRDDAVDPAQTQKAVARIISSKPLSNWLEAFMHKDVCVQVVHSVGEARQDPHFIHRGVFEHQIATDLGILSALPVPIASCFRDPPGTKDYPRR